MKPLLGLLFAALIASMLYASCLDARRQRHDDLMAVSEKKSQITIQLVSPVQALVGTPVEFNIHIPAITRARIASVEIDTGDGLFGMSTFDVNPDTAMIRFFSYPRIGAGRGEEGLIVITVVVYSDLGPVARAEKSVYRRAD